MSETVQAEVSVQEAPAVQVPKSVAQRASRKRFSFGSTWNAAVIAGTATDEAKLMAQATKLKLGAKSDLRRLKLATLRSKVAAKLQAQSTPSAPQVVEGAMTLDAKLQELSQ